MNAILVTGASGFVGRAVCQCALNRGIYIKGSHRSAGSGMLVPSGVERFEIPSVDSRTDWSKALSGIEVVVHLAARVHMVEDTARDPLSIYREVNVAGSEHLARMAAAAGVKRFVYMSTIKVNGEETRSEPFCEADSPRPEDAYAISKWEAEQALHRVARDTGLSVVILRPPLVYGKGVGANFLRLLAWVRRRIPLPLASVSNRRSLIYVENLAHAVVDCTSHPAAPGGIYLVRDDESVSTPELIGRIASLMKLRDRTFSFPPGLLRLAARAVGRSAEVNRLLRSLVIDDRKIRSEIGWLPRYSLAQGLRETVDWYLMGCPVAGGDGPQSREQICCNV